MDVSDIFIFLPGGGEGGVRGARKGAGVGFLLLKIPGAEGGGGGEIFQERGGVGKGPGVCLWGIWGGGGSKHFFSGPKFRCLLNPSRGPKSNRTSRLFQLVLCKGKATKFVRTRGFSKNSLVSGSQNTFKIVDKVMN